VTRAPVIATALAKATDTYPENLCLRFTRSLFGIDPKFASAAEAWEHTDDRHSSWPPPPGSVVWWTGGNGHVAPSAGGGRVYTTDNPLEGPGEVGLCPIGTITSSWRKVYQGWTDDCNDVAAYVWSAVDLAQLREAAHLDPKGDASLATYPVGVRQVEAALYLLGLLGRAWAFDGHWGTATTNAYARYQRALGYSGSDADGIPGRATLGLLGQRFHWKVT